MNKSRRSSLGGLTWLGWVDFMLEFAAQAFKDMRSDISDKNCAKKFLFGTALAHLKHRPYEIPLVLRM